MKDTILIVRISKKEKEKVESLAVLRGISMSALTRETLLSAFSEYPNSENNRQASSPSRHLVLAGEGVG